MNTTSPFGNGIEGRARWSLRLFGGFELSALPSGERVAPPGKRERVLLAYLALSLNHRQPRRKLVSLLWGDAADETTLDNLRNCLWNLRKALGDTEHRIVASEGEDVVLDAAAFEVDASAFRRLAVQSGRPELEAAAALHIGEFLDGLVIESDEFESWRRAEASRYRDQAVDVLTRLMTQFSECGETERAIAMGERILRLEPLHEAAVRRLMRHYGESGRRGAAIQLYRTFAEALRTELDAEPEGETRLAFAEIARGREEPTSVPAASDTTLSPRSTSIARPSGTLGGVLRQAFRLRASLAVLAGALLVATALMSYRQYTLVGTPDGIVAERAAAANPASAISIAVLPFLNLSGDAGQEFFSDGMTEEITSALAMVPDLKVVARTSAFQFKGEKNDMRAVGQALNATHLVEGSVRKVGDRVRITAQLIEVGKGTHLWSENYDRQLSDIFATQEEIARTVVGSLMAPLGLAPGERLVRSRTSDLESYDQYLRARALIRGRAITDAIKLLEQAVARDQDFAPAWALLAQAYVLLPAWNAGMRRDPLEAARRDLQFSQEKAEKAAGEAVRLDSQNTDGYTALALIQAVRGHWAAAEDLYKQALALDANEPDALHHYSNMLDDIGRLRDSLSLREKLQTLEPFVPIYNIVTAAIMRDNGQRKAAMSLLEVVPADAAGGYYRNLILAQAYAAEGRHGEAADTLLAMRTNLVDRRSVEDAARLLRSVPTKVNARLHVPVLEGELSFVYAYVGVLDRVLEFPERTVDLHNVSVNGIRYLWLPELAAARKTERFKTYAHKAGLVDYWRARGWPDLCRPVGADDFACD